MNRRDYALLALSLSPDGALAPVQMQKAMFLVSEHLHPRVTDGFYHFEPYHYGPFDRNIYVDLDLMVDENFVQRVKSTKYPGTEFQITDQGRIQLTYRPNELAAITPYLTAVVTWMRPLSFSQLVSAIYEMYPRFREKSIFRG